jgi:hypothetical protein
MLTLEGTEYDRFRIDDLEQKALTLDEAAKKASELRKGDSKNFYRVEIADEASGTFRVKKVDTSEVYAGFLGRVANIMGRYVFRSRQR